MAVVGGELGFLQVKCKKPQIFPNGQVAFVAACRLCGGTACKAGIACTPVLTSVQAEEPMATGYAQRLHCIL